MFDEKNSMKGKIDDAYMAATSAITLSSGAAEAVRRMVIALVVMGVLHLAEITVIILLLLITKCA